MAKNFVQSGGILTVTAPAAVDSGDLIKVGNIFGVAITDAASGAPVAIQVDGVHELPKAAPLVIDAGDPVYWSTSNGNFSKTATSNWYLGVAAEDAASADTTVKVRLNGSFPKATG